MPLQDWIHRLEEGGGAKIIKRIAATLAFVVVAAMYDSLDYQGFSTQEAMESAQLARNVAQGKGWVTDSIRPLVLYLLDRTNPGSARHALQEGVPDLTQPPLYPMALAGVMKVLPFNFTAKTLFYQPDFWIAIFNQTLLFVAVLLLFSIARRLFDARVAWLSAILFAGTELFWRFTVSGLSTTLLEVIFLAMVRAMLAFEERGRARETQSVAGCAVAIGALAGLGMLTRYSFGWILLPALVFCAFTVARARWKMFFLIVVSFLVVALPWLIRNHSLSGNFFGTSAYAPIEETPIFNGDQLQRSLNPEPGFKQMRGVYLKEKLFVNLQGIIAQELPMIGGNWLSAFFLVGLLIPFRNPALGRLRLFLVGAVVVWATGEAVGSTSLSKDSPGVNSENLLVILAPLFFAYGAGLFFTLLDQLNVATNDLRALVVAVFTVVLCLPLVLAAFSPPEIPITTPYTARHIQVTSRMLGVREWMMSDIPWAVSWYGQRPCLWLTLDDGDEFRRANSLKPVNALFLTQRTTDSSLLPQLTGATNSWGRFFWDCWAHGEVPTGFPLQKAPVGFLPDQMLLCDRVRWQ